MLPDSNSPLFTSDNFVMQVMHSKAADNHVSGNYNYSASQKSSPPKTFCDIFT